MRDSIRPYNLRRPSDSVSCGLIEQAGYGGSIPLARLAVIKGSLTGFIIGFDCHTNMNKADLFIKQAYLDILEKRIKDIKEGYRQNLAILGDKDIGKTSIILQFLNRFNDPLILPVYLELRPEYNKEQFVRKFIGALLYNFLENSNISLHEDIDFLISKASSFIPQTTQQIQNILNSFQRKNKAKPKDKENILIQLLTLLDTIHSETQKRCVVIFDEFHHLSSIGIRQVYKQFSKILMIQKNVLYIILSSAKFKTKKILSTNLSLLFGNFEVIEVAAFDLKTTKEYFKHQLKGPQIQGCLIDFLVHFTGGMPLYMKIISDAVKNSSNFIDRQKIAEVILDLLFVESGILNQRFNNYLNLLQNFKAAQDYQALLYLIADGQNRIKDIAVNLHLPKAQITSRLNLLMEYDIVTKTGDFYVITDRVFSFWLKFVYREKSKSLTFHTEQQEKNFRDIIEDKINQFIIANQKSVLERTIELLHLFANESIQLRTKRIRLVQFREIKVLNFNRSRINEGLLGRSKDILWIMAIKPDNLMEEDIADFAKQCQRLRYVKPQKKVIITNSNIDTNVRLKAMEEKVLTWDLDDLNTLLDLYNKPRVIP